MQVPVNNPMKRNAIENLAVLIIEYFQRINRPLKTENYFKY